MELPTLLLTIMSATLSNNLKQTTQSDRFNLNAFDCHNPSKIVSFLTKDWCSPTNRSDTFLGEKRTVTILQEAKFQVVSGIRCTKQVSKFLVYCGSYSHMKLFGPPMILDHDSRFMIHNDRRLLRHVQLSGVYLPWQNN